MIDWSRSVSVKIAAKIIGGGGVVAYPTEGVWGLGCDPFNEFAVRKILQLKERSINKGLILIGSAIGQFDFLLDDISDEKFQHLKKTWPGPFTWIVPHHQQIPNWVSGNHSGVAIRVSDHPLVQALCNCYGGPIISTSANRQSKPSATTRLKVRCYFGRSPQLEFITPGVIGKNQRPSEIRDLNTMALVRA
ncbi:MAG: L-threonylcarbamoyladenylate synthase [Cellvibrionaceae bacterium]|jgi:L-threonylcarbamoyladenylate synthase